jgi:tetratricopeptide (TPR) repeat protein
MVKLYPDIIVRKGAGIMKKHMSILLASLLVIMSVSAFAAGNYSGEWSYQALNAGDTNFKVEHSQNKITFYRILYPEFEGERYKLEHMFKGNIKTNKINGQLLVREEGMDQFEQLRPFLGKIKSQTMMEVDGMVLKKVTAVTDSVEPQEDRQKEAKPKYSKVVIKRKPKEEPVAEKPQEKSAQAETAPVGIPKLIPVERRMLTENGRKADALLKEGDDFYEQKKYRPALDRFEAAYKLNPGKVEVLYKMGLGYGILGSMAAKKEKKDLAISRYQKAIEAWKKAVRYDPYNSGAKENIRRAEGKIAKLRSI